jgi:hypothetical protein
LDGNNPTAIVGAQQNKKPYWGGYVTNHEWKHYHPHEITTD